MKFLRKFKDDRKVVRDTFHSLTSFQKIWLTILTISTVLVIFKVVNTILLKVTEFISNKRNKEDYSDDCPDFCEDQDDDLF